jgi:multidrug resistance efflux pump
VPQRDPPIRSEEVDDILGTVPAWVTRTGNSLLWMVFAILLVLSWSLRYPDVVSSRISITALEPPVRLVAQSSGRLEKLLVTEGQVVAQGEWLGVLENTADHRDVQRVTALLPEIARRMHDPSLLAQLPVDLPEDVELGPVHIAYSALKRSLLAYQLFCKEAYHDKKIALLATQVRWQRQIASHSRARLAIVERELALSTSARDRERALLVAGVSSTAEAENAESSLAQKRRLGTEVQAELLDQELRIQDYEKAQLDLERERAERNQELLLAIQEAYKMLYSQLAEWEQHFVIKSPLEGRVALHKVWANHQYVTTGTEVMAVLPSRTRLLGRIELGQQSSGKVLVGQRVNVMLDGYPFREFGVLCGTVQSIAPISQGGAYVVHVSFSGDELQSSFGRRFEFKDGMQGSADIITDDLRLIERILDRVLYRMKQS